MPTLNATLAILCAHQWARIFFALVIGALIPLSLAPFNQWPLAIISLSSLLLLMREQKLKMLLALSFSFGIGMYGVGVSWVYVSIHTYGGAPWFMAGLMTAVFVAFLAFIFSLPFILLSKLKTSPLWSFSLAFIALWSIGEWIRSWLFTGFPWLYLGYGHLTSPLGGYAPLIGVIGISTLVAASAACLSLLITKKQPAIYKIIAATSFAVIWLAGYFLQPQSWTQLSTQPVQVGMVQPNIAQDVKWQLSYVDPTLNLLNDLSEPLYKNDWLIWPEAAIPLTYHQALNFLDDINNRASENNTALVTGIIFDDLQKNRYYNSIAGFGDAMGIYHKRRLVPFGEYVPLEHYLRGLIEFFNLPTSIISLGPQDQQAMLIKGTKVAPAVCYELVYPTLIADSAKATGVLLSVSNLGWFGESIGPPQFMQMGQMRAKETGRFLIYSTNNGPSALINQRGEITIQSTAFSTTVVEGTIFEASGSTPFMRVGHWPLVIFWSFVLAFLITYTKRHR